MSKSKEPEDNNNPNKPKEPEGNNNQAYDADSIKVLGGLLKRPPR